MMKFPFPLLLSPSRGRARASGFTLVEMIVVIVITGIIGGMVAMFIRAPVQGYMDSARRAEMTDIADTALRRLARDLRLALPNSVRVSPDGRYLEFIPTVGGGRYRADAGGTNNVLDFTAADTSFEVLGPMPVLAANDEIVVYNLGIAGADAYQNNNRATYLSNAGGVINFTAGRQFPFESPSRRFHVVTPPVTYACTQPAGGVPTLTRYWGYGFQATQPIDVGAPPLSTATSAQLASNLGSAGLAILCTFTYESQVVAQRTGLVTMLLTLTKDGESVRLYHAVHVSNEP